MFARWEKSKDQSQAVLKIKGRGGGGQKNKEKEPSKKRKVEEEDEEKEQEEEEDEGESVVNDMEEEEQQQEDKVQSRDVANKTKVSGAKEGSVEKKRKTVEKQKKATPKETDGGGPDWGVGGDDKQELMKVLVANDEAAPVEMKEEHEQKQECKQESKREQRKSAGRKKEAANKDALGIQKKRARAGGALESVGLVEKGVAGGVLEERGEGRNGIRIGDKMKGKYKSTPGWYGCKVVAMTEEGKWVVEWDDGDEEDTVKDARHLRQ